MGYVLKELKERVLIRVDNYQIIPEEKASELAATGVVQSRRAFVIFLYPESKGEFAYFYKRHVLHIEGKGEATVLVADGEFPINEVMTRAALEKALRTAVIRVKMDELSIAIPQVVKGHVLSVREWDFGKEEFTTPTHEGWFIFRDIHDISSQNALLGKQDTVDEKEFEKVLTFFYGWKKMDEDYAVVRVCFIGKYFVS